MNTYNVDVDSVPGLLLAETPGEKKKEEEKN